MKAALVMALVTVLIMGGAAKVSSKSIVTSRHNLSLSGPGTIKAAEERNICVFCHTPHNSDQAGPLWNRLLPNVSYTTYSSTTAKAAIGQPSGASKLCLSCHDGTIALGMVRSEPTPIPFLGGVTTLPPGRTLLGTDLSDDHPVSFIYDGALASARGDLVDPALLSGPVRLDPTGRLQCTSCHNPHDDEYGSFLVMDNSFSALCLSCHGPPAWANSSHKQSGATWNGAGTDPWPHTSYTTVASNGCENCHRPHSAGLPRRLLNYPLEEENCASCHNANVASKNVAADFGKPSIHPISQTSGTHDAAEDPASSPRHVECQDCHNGHAANSAIASPPAASGKLAGVAGISLEGGAVRPISYQYQLCFRCHGDSNSGVARVNRLIYQTNTRLEFNPANASYHPVAAAGKNPNVPSLLQPYTTSSLIYCSDCHNSDSSASAGGVGPNGPHGSIWSPILERQMVFTDNTPESPSVYALCYKCHNRASILANESFKEHKRHIEGVKTPCTTCHDPHGVATATHLINFNIDIVRPNRNGILRFEDRGTFAGACYLNCHNRDHDPSRGSGDYP